MTKCITLFAVVLGAANLTGQLFGTQQRGGAAQSISGTYINPNYFFSVKIPEGLKASVPSPPEPQHGFRMDLNKGGDYLWVDGSWDSLLLESADAAASYETERLQKQYRLDLVTKTRTELSGLEARDVILENARGSGRIDYVHFIVAFRKVPKGVGIVYTVELLGKSRDATTESVFTSIANSFHTTKMD